MILIGLLRVVVCIATIIFTFKWMMCSSTIIIDYVKTIREAGKDKEYHFEHLKMIGLFVFNFILFRESFRQIFGSVYTGQIYGWLGKLISGEVLLSFSLFVVSGLLLVLICVANKKMDETFKF